jgi:Ca2+-binding RTX toxin-like protein
MKTTLLAGLVLTSATALFTSSASAAVSCDVTSGPTPTVNVTLTAPGDQALITVDDFTYIRVNDAQCFDPTITAATTDNVDAIHVNDTTAGATATVIRNPKAFAPGATSELGTSEIEFDVDFGIGAADTLQLEGNAGPDTFVAGTNGINTNSPDPLPDVDIVATAADRHVYIGGGGTDVLSAGGNALTGGPISVPAELRGDAGTDQLEGGTDDDTLDGGADTDNVSYSRAPAGVTVDLATTGPQPTGGAGTDTLTSLERVIGSDHDDRITAVPTADTVISGGEGNDVLVGSLHSDAIIGGLGNDSLDDGGGQGSDIVEGGPGIDTITYARASNRVRINLDTTNPQSTYGAGQDMISFVENVEGSPFDDELFGTPDENVITGGAGKDTIDGSTGPDEFRVRDGESDQVICGDGADIVSADRVGVDALNGCETTDFAPEPTAPEQPGNNQPGTGNPTPPPALDSSILLRVGGSKSQRALRSRHVTLTSTCPAERCTITASPILKVAKKGRKAAITRSLPAVQTTLLPAVQRTLKVTLTKKHLATLKAAKRRGAKATITVAVTARDAAGNATTINRKIALR